MEDDSLSDIRGRRIGFIFQSYNNCPAHGLENIQVPFYRAEYGRIDRCGAAVLIRGALRIANQLSGGRQQRWLYKSLVSGR